MTFSSVIPTDAAKKAKKPSSPAAAASFMAHATPAAAGEALTADSNILLKDSDPKSTVILAQNAQDVLQTASDAAGVPAADASASAGEVGAMAGASAVAEAGSEDDSGDQQKDDTDKKSKKKEKRKHSQSAEEKQKQLAETNFRNNVLILMIAVAAMGGTAVLFMQMKKDSPEVKKKETVAVNEAKLARIKQKAADLAGTILNKNPGLSLPR
eukprot:CAMPEP_0114303946 /NCGR_PEP_ID=MMETSP0059-20121206/15506_1 /TAXON_ID=36894 /ORGANISM="Pyramimonas parkeae, Strain CCMP726" /LENGTH=211 /DNA_ID=CAMNT_0001426975 /DNA_START=96 /DNA_END=731 /DNA_ORIENTATION=+